MTSWSISRSSHRSATIFFSLEILVRKLLEPPHLRRLQALVFLRPIEIGRLADAAFWQTSATGTPSAPCLRMNAVCASENYDAFIVFRSCQPGERYRGKL